MNPILVLKTTLFSLQLQSHLKKEELQKRAEAAQRKKYELQSSTEAFQKEKVFTAEQRIFIDQLKVTDIPAARTLDSQFYPKNLLWSEKKWQYLIEAEHVFKLALRSTTPNGSTQLIGNLVVVNEGDCYKIWTVTVAKEFQRRGYATKMLKEFANKLDHSIPTILLSVELDNPAAQALYTNLGFSEYARTRGMRRMEIDTQQFVANLRGATAMPMPTLQL